MGLERECGDFLSLESNFVRQQGYIKEYIVILMATSVVTVSGHKVTDTSPQKTTSGPLGSQPHWILKRFLKGQPKALGVVQIMIGLMHMIVWTNLLVEGIFLQLTCLFFIISGSCSVATENKLTRLRIKWCLGWNIVSCCMAVYEIIVIAILFGDHSPRPMISEVLFLSIFTTFMILEFCIALSTSIFGCKSLCYDPSKDPAFSAMEAIPAPLSELPYEVLTSRPHEYETLQLP